VAALWYFVFVLPMFLFTPDAAKGRKAGSAVRAGLKELRATLGDVRGRPGILRFLVARMIYQDGVNALLALGGAFAALMFGWSTTEIGLYGIILNVVAILGCWVAARLDSALGSKKVVVISLAMLAVATVGIVSTGKGYTLFGALVFTGMDTGGLFGTAAEKTYIAFGLLVGLAFGPVQASSRSYLARSVSADDAGRYFGIYALAGRATSFAAPFLVATVTAASGSPRLGMAVIILFLLGGLGILLPTPYPAAEPDESRVP
jgi:UMF1 family MFS transporter